MKSWKYPLLFGLSRTLVVLILVIFVRWISGSLRPWPDAGSFGIALLGLFAFLTLLARLIVWFYGAEATPHSLRIRFWSSRYVEVPWQQIEAVHPMSLLGFPLVRLRYSGAQRPALLPLWLAEDPEFRNAISTYAGDRNLLAEWLVQNPHAGRFRFW